jgi:transposase
MSYSIAGIDVHKKMLAVATADVETAGEYQFQERKFGANPSDLRAMAEWLVEQGVEEVVMESTAQYWRPVWHALEQHWQPERRKREGAGKMAGTLHLAQAQSNRARHGRKNDFEDAQRLVKRLVAQELVLSFVPNAEQRLWRTVSHRKYQLTRDKVRVRNQMEGLLEETNIKLTSLVSDLFGVSGRRMLRGIADGESDPAVLAALADHRLRATPEQLRDALGACAQLHPVYRQLVEMFLGSLKQMEEQIETLDKQIAKLLEPYQDAVQRLAEVPGLGVDSAQQIIAQVGPAAVAFPCAKSLASWVGVCPGRDESAGESKSNRSPKGNRALRRVLNQAAHAAIRYRGSIFELTFRRLLPRLGYQQAAWAIAHRLCNLIWILLHKGDRYREMGPEVRAKSQKARVSRMIRELRKLGYQVDSMQLAAGSARWAREAASTR